MIKLVVFDLDGTLAPIGKGADERTVQGLKELEKRGIKIAISSGKPSFYLCGFCRQTELNDPILIGENGGMIQFGIDLPPRYFESFSTSKNTNSKLSELKFRIQEEIPYTIWFQPNEVGLTSFFHSEEEKLTLRKFFAENVSDKDDLIVYEHADSFDVTPKGIDKKSSLLKVQTLLNLNQDEVVAVGNGVNDYPMFEAAGFSIAIGEHDSSVATVLVNDIHQALDILLENTKNC